SSRKSPKGNVAIYFCFKEYLKARLLRSLHSLTMTAREEILTSANYNYNSLAYARKGLPNDQGRTAQRITPPHCAKGSAHRGFL
ncbi:MAG: hypothetical protein ACP5QX_03605, partial [Caldisericaceae bacterium]